MATNFTFQNGSLWFPVVNRVTGETILPRMTKNDFGSITPFVIVKSPGIFDSVGIPYENIVSFEWNVIGLTATLTFLDTTPIFIEEIIRRTINARREGAEQSVIVEFGWRIQNPIGDIIDLVDDRGLLSSGNINGVIFNATYGYTNFGVMPTIEMSTSTKSTLESVVLKGKTLTADQVTQKEAVQTNLTTLINDQIASVGSQEKYRVIILSDDIRYDKMVAVQSKPDSKHSLKWYIEELAKKMYVPIPEKVDPFGNVDVWLGTRLETQPNEAGVQESFYPIYFYHRDKLPQEASNIPQIQYPANESPIINWSPTMQMNNLTFFKSDKYRYRDTDGNEIEETKPAQAIVAGINAPTTGQSITVDGSDASIQGQRRRRGPGADIDISYLGDPLLNDINTQFAKLNISNPDIVQQGVLKSNSDFFSNFPQIDSGLAKTLPIIHGIPGGSSPFNGEYTLNSITHKIGIGEGFTTNLNVYWYGDIEIEV